MPSTDARIRKERSTAASCGAGPVTARAPCGTALPAGSTTEIGDHLAGGVLAGTAGDAAAGVGPGAAEVQAIECEAVAGVAEERAPHRPLVEARLGVEGMAATQAIARFEIHRGQDLAMADELGDPRRDRLERPDDGIAKGLALVVPGPARGIELVRRVLGDDAHDV